MARRIKPLKLQSGDLCDLLMFWLTDGASEEGLMQFERQLTVPPPMTEISADDPIWGAESEMEMFLKAMQ